MDFSRIINEVQIVAVRSRGPGGQNVNKVSSAAQLFWNFADSQGLNMHEKSLVAEKMRNLINSEQQVYLRADEYRDLERNKARALEKLEMFLVKALHRPKTRRATKPTRASKVRKLEGKAHRGNIKKGRQKVDWD
ncbi:MAG: alternative ribosome rescue aminoacyl-tRNA hydrolase ArfB [Bdellovibrionales bacterium]